MTADAFRMNRFTLRFAGADMEVAFADEQARKAVRPVRITVGVLAVCAVVYALTHRPVFVKRRQLIIFLIVCLMSVGISQGSAQFPLEVLDVTTRVSVETGGKLALRIGLHSGPEVAAVIGRRKFTYDLWGDTVNTASRMESHGVPGTIHCSEATATLLQGAFQLRARGAMEIKGKGEMNTFLPADAARIPNG